MSTITYTDPDTTSVSDSGRMVTMRWLRPDAPIRRKGSAACEVTVSHDKARKVFRVSINVCEVEGIWVSTLIGRGHYMTLAVEPAARFSRAKLDALVNETLATILPESIAHDRRAASLFAGIPFEVSA